MLQLLPAPVLRLLAFFALRWPRLAGILSNSVINTAVGMVRRRPHPWSTAHPYVSWVSLTDQRWSARHLPPAQPPVQPERAQVLEFFAAPASGQEECKKSTLLFPAFAQYLTDSFIRTQMPNLSGKDADEVRKRNTSNHQIDMCPLYGRNEEHTGILRAPAGGEAKGRLKSQIIGGEEYAPFLCDENGAVKPEFGGLDPVLGFDKVPPERRSTLFAFGGDRANATPQVAMMNTLFLREHNRLAGAIEAAHPDWDDDRVFETARNTVIVLFIKLVVEEYIRHVAPTPFTLFAAPEVAWLAPWNKPNWITVEFSLLYRWHSLLPAIISWDGKGVPVEATFFNNQMLLDVGLRSAFQELSGQSATRLGAFNTSPALVPIEEKALVHAQVCQVDTYAAYRAYMAMPEMTAFEDISSDPRVVEKLRALYGRPEHVEFYVGLFAEDTVRNSPLPNMILRFVAVDAFSQALTNPLLSEHVFKQETFSAPGWEAISATSRVADIVERTCAPLPSAAPAVPITMTKPDWTYEWPGTGTGEIITELRALATSAAGRTRLFGFALSTVAEVAGLLLWLPFALADRPVAGAFWLIAGEAVEWALLATMLINSPLSRPKRTGRVGRGLALTALISLSEAALWITWLALIGVIGLVPATALLFLAMHFKHGAELSVFTGRPYVAGLLDGRDIAASAFEAVGAALWIALTLQGHAILGGAVLLLCIAIEHILQFKTAGFLKLKQ